MKKRSKRETPSVSLTPDPNLAELVGKIQQHLFSLEKKIDSLISRPPERSFEGKHFSKPFQPFDRSGRHDRGKEGGGFRDRKLYKVICAECKKECEVPFRPSDGRPVYCKECFSRRKGDAGSFTEKRDNTPRNINEDRGFDQKRKPRRKKRG